MLQTLFWRGTSKAMITLYDIRTMLEHDLSDERRTWLLALALAGIAFLAGIPIGLLTRLAGI